MNDPECKCGNLSMEKIYSTTAQSYTRSVIFHCMKCGRLKKIIHSAGKIPTKVIWREPIILTKDVVEEQENTSDTTLPKSLKTRSETLVRQLKEGKLDEEGT